METLRAEQLDNEEDKKEFTVKLLDTDGGVALPSVSNEETENEVITSMVGKAIQSDSIKRIIVEEDANIEMPNYVIDFSEVESMSVMNKEALRSLISTNGEVALYLYKKGKLMKVGYGISNKLASAINTFRNYVFDEKVKVYQNLDGEGHFTEVKTRDISKLRMNI